MLTLLLCFLWDFLGIQVRRRHQEPTGENITGASSQRQKAKRRGGAAERNQTKGGRNKEEHDESKPRSCESVVSRVSRAAPRRSPPSIYACEPGIMGPPGYPKTQKIQTPIWCTRFAYRPVGGRLIVARAAFILLVASVLVLLEPAAATSGTTRSFCLHFIPCTFIWKRTTLQKTDESLASVGWHRATTCNQPVLTETFLQRLGSLATGRLTVVQFSTFP